MPKLKPRAEVTQEQLQALVNYQNQLLAANNITQYDPSQPHPDFDAACEKFRGVCASIQKLLGIERFLGSYDEIEMYKDSEELKSEEGRALKEDLTLYNQLCIHEGNKIGLPPPQWFKKCWGLD